MAAPREPGRHRRWPPILWPIAALAALLAFNLVFTPGFFSIRVQDGRLYGSLVDVLDRAAPLILVSVGMTLVIATAGIDLSVGAVMAIAGAVAVCLLERGGSAIALAGAAALLAATVAGVGNGVLIRGLGIQPIVATLILMVAGRGVAQLLTGGQIVTTGNPALAFVGNGALLGLPVPAWIALGTTVVVAVLARATALGLFLEAIGGNPVASHQSGVPALRVTIVVYALCAALAGVAGIIVTADIQAIDVNNNGLYIELDAILAVVIGGTALTGGRFSIVGSVIGALLIQCLTTTILSRGVAVEWTLVVKAAVVIAVCLLQSSHFRAVLRGAARRARGTPA